jgi:hypothetical protein
MPVIPSYMKVLGESYFQPNSLGDHITMKKTLDIVVCVISETVGSLK